MNLRRSTTRKRKEWTIPVSIFAMCATILCGVFAFYSIRKDNKTELDDSLCPTNSLPSSYDVILLDISDSLNVTQKAFIKRELHKIKSDVGLHGKIAVYSVRDRLENQIYPAISLCNPGRGEQLSKWTANPQMALRKWRSSFSSRLDSMVDTYLSDSIQPYSPIMETIQAVSVTFFPVKSSENRPRNIYIVSDMLQHTPDYSHYKSGPPKFAEFKGTAYYMRVSTNLRNSDISIFYIRRPGQNHVQGKIHKEFWNEYIHSLNGNLKLVRQVEG